MAKAGAQSTVWLSLLKAHAFAVGVCISSSLAQKRLKEALVNGTAGVDWRCKHAENVTSLSDFWHHSDVVMDLPDSSAWRPVVFSTPYDPEEVIRPGECTGAIGVGRGTLYGVEISEDYLKRFFAPKTDEWLLATRAKIIAEEPKITLRPLAAKIFPMMVKAVEAGENIELLQEGTLPSRLSRLLSKKVLPGLKRQ